MAGDPGAWRPAGKVVPVAPAPSDTNVGWVWAKVPSLQPADRFWTCPGRALGSESPQCAPDSPTALQPSCGFSPLRAPGQAPWKGTFPACSVRRPVLGSGRDGGALLPAPFHVCPGGTALVAAQCRHCVVSPETHPTPTTGCSQPGTRHPGEGSGSLMVHPGRRTGPPRDRPGTGWALKMPVLGAASSQARP